jgi:cytochrome c biogenesis protein CcmG/thiol:disulfide interchange protein DsbE
VAVTSSLLVGAVWSAGCGIERPQGPPRAGDPVPAFSVVSLDGTEVSLADYRGRGVILNLWATWCPPCRAEMPYLQELQDQFREDGLSVVGVSVDNTGARASLDAFLREADVTYDILLDPAMRSMDLFGVLGLPATFLVDPSGVVTYMRTGPIMEGDETFLAEIQAILPDTGTPAQAADPTTDQEGP